MKRDATGSFRVTTTAGERVRAFVPAPLPPTPALEITGPRQLLLEKATLAVGRLDSISTFLPDPHLFLYSYVRREAVLSSQIEGTQLTGKRRNRIFVYHRYLNILNEGGQA